jgi:hypothetical protein
MRSDALKISLAGVRATAPGPDGCDDPELIPSRAPNSSVAVSGDQGK